MKKIVLVLTVFLLFFGLAFVGCDHDGRNGGRGRDKNIEIPETRPPYKNYTGTVSGTGRGYKSTITVYLTLANGIINDVNITHDDTPRYADSAVADAKMIILQSNSFELDAISGATATRNGIIEAGKAALRSKGLID